ncbi:MAG: hypothetical protein P4M11_15675 [Candidatus Pacebacteria bacterium]|nr:hypothetical protein [Candidatus Paceibacterota bacterium]
MFKEKPKIQAGFIATIGILLTTYCVYYALFMYLPKRYISLMLEFGSHLENIMGDASEFVGALVAQRYPLLVGNP